MRRLLLTAVICIILLLPACRPAAPTPLPSESTAAGAMETEAIQPAETAAPVEPTLPLPTETAPPNTPTPVPTETLVPTPLPTSAAQVLTAETLRQARLIGRLGSGALVTAALSPDALQVAVLTTTELLVYDTAAGTQTWRVPLERVYTRVVFSGDGTQIVAGTRGGSVSRWDAASGEQMPDILPVVANARAVALAGNGALLAALDVFDQTYIRDTVTGEQVQTNNGLAYPFGAMQIAVSDSGKIFLNSGIDSKENYQIRVWSVERGRFLANLQGLPDEVYDLDFSPDGQYVAALDTRVSGGLRGMQYLYLWRASNGALLDTVDLSLDATVYGFLSSLPAVTDPTATATPAGAAPADGNITVLAGTAGGKVIIVNFRIGERFTYGFVQDQIPAHVSPVVSLSSSADGSKFASAAADGSVKVWDVQTGETVFDTQVPDLSLQNVHAEWVYQNLEVQELQHESGFSVSPAGNLIARTAPDLRSIELIDPFTGSVTMNLKIETQAYFNSPCFSPDGRFVAAVLDGKRITVWDVETGIEQMRISTQHIKPVSRLRFSPDGASIASMSDGELFVWTLDPVGQKHALTAFNNFVWSADGAYIVTDTQETGINLLDGATGRKITYIETGYVNGVAISPDSTMAAVAGWRSQARYQQDNLVYFIDLLQQKRVRTLEITGYPAEAVNVEYSPDGSAIVTADLYGDVYIWNTATGALLQHFAEAVPMPAQIAFSADGKSLYIQGSDNSVQIYQSGQ